MATARWILAIDTAGSRCSVAVGDEAGTAGARREPEIGRGHAERLMGLAEEVLTEARIAYGDLSKIVVTVGPGSFTGLRVGVAAARALALTLEIPVLGLSTLEALAEPLWAKGPVLSVLDAKRGEAYAALFAGGGAVLREPQAVPLEALARFLPRDLRPAAIVGSGGAIAAQGLGLFDCPRFGADGHVDIAAVLRLGAARIPVEAPRPLYLRGADAKPQPSLRPVEA